MFSKFYRYSILVHNKLQFKHHVEAGILSTPNTTPSTESAESIENFHRKIMDDQIDGGNDAFPSLFPCDKSSF